MHYSGWLLVLGVAIFGMVYPYTIYPLCLWLLSKVVRRQKILWQHYQIPPFTIIIPAYNEEKVIQRKLLNTLQCAERAGAPYEVIVVSDGSTDRTAEIVRGFERAVMLIELPQRGGKMAALRAGVEASSYDILVFTDADAFLHEDAILNLLRHFVHQEIGGVGAAYQSQATENSGLEGESVKSKMDGWIRAYQSRFHSAIGSTGTVWAARKQAVAALALPVIADDLVLPLEVVHSGYRFVYDAEAIGVYKLSKTVEAEFNRKVRVVCGGLQAAWLCRWMFSPRWFPIVGFHFLSWKLGKYLVGVWGILATVAIIALASTMLWARMLLITLVAVLILAASSRTLQIRSSSPVLRLLNMAWYAVVMNAVPIVAVWRLLGKQQTALWQKTTR